MKQKFTIVYLAYGQDSSKYQVVLSIYTLYHHLGAANQDYVFVIYTDADRTLLDKYLEGLPIKLEILSKETVKQFRGPNNFIFRIKSCVIKDCLAKYKCGLLYVDTDTFFLRDPQQLLASIREGRSIMNVKEYDFTDGGAVEPVHWFNLRQVLKRYPYKVGTTEVYIPIHTMMWNAGVIGLSYEDAGLVDEIIQLTDEMYARCQTFIVEQFVTSYILQTKTELHSTEDYIEHYWPKDIKNSFNLRIPGFLKEQAAEVKQPLFDAAFAFAKEVKSISTPYREPLLDRISTRMKLIIKVARQGYL